MTHLPATKQLSFLVVLILQLSCGLLLKFLNHVTDHALGLDEDVLNAVKSRTLTDAQV